MGNLGMNTTIQYDSITAKKINAGNIPFTENDLKELQQYRQIGTIEECREAMKKQKVIKVKEIEDDYFVCPSCKVLISSLADFENHKYCLNCGQALGWEGDK